MLSLVDDLRVWINDTSDIYLASLAYLKLFAEEPKMRGLSRQQLQNLSKVWMSSAPTKVVSFSWKILLEKAHIRLKLFPLSGYSWCGDSYLLVVRIHLGFGMKFIFHHWFLPRVWQNIFIWFSLGGVWLSPRICLGYLRVLLLWLAGQLRRREMMLFFRECFLCWDYW